MLLQVILHVLLEKEMSLFYYSDVFSRTCLVSDIVTGVNNEVTITGLKPDSSYEVKLAAINGKGEGESSPAEFFKTEPVRKCTIYSTSFYLNLFHFCLHKHITLSASL